MNFILRVVRTSYLTSCASGELNMMFSITYYFIANLSTIFIRE